jgi:hypothetical protein
MAAIFIPVRSESHSMASELALKSKQSFLGEMNENQ